MEPFSEISPLLSGVLTIVLLSFPPVFLYVIIPAAKEYDMLSLTVNICVLSFFALFIVCLSYLIKVILRSPSMKRIQFGSTRVRLTVSNGQEILTLISEILLLNALNLNFNVLPRDSGFAQAMSDIYKVRRRLLSWRSNTSVQYQETFESYDLLVGAVVVGVCSFGWSIILNFGDSAFFRFLKLRDFLVLTVAPLVRLCHL